MPWEKRYDDSEVLERAMHAFWAHGYEATSVSDLVQATGLNRGSLYSAFSDKRDLFIAALRHYDRTERSAFLDRLSRDNGPREAIVAAFAAAASTRPDAPAGCLLVNTALEVAPHDPTVRRLVNAALAEVEAFFHERIAEGRASGEIPATTDAAATAQALLGLFLGLRVLARSGAAQTARDAIVRQAEALLG